MKDFITRSKWRILRAKFALSDFAGITRDVGYQPLDRLVVPGQISKNSTVSNKNGRDSPKIRKSNVYNRFRTDALDNGRIVTFLGKYSQEPRCGGGKLWLPFALAQEIGALKGQPHGEINGAVYDLSGIADFKGEITAFGRKIRFTKDYSANPKHSTTPDVLYHGEMRCGKFEGGWRFERSAEGDLQDNGEFYLVPEDSRNLEAQLISQIMFSD